MGCCMASVMETSSEAERASWMAALFLVNKVQVSCVGVTQHSSSAGWCQEQTTSGSMGVCRSLLINAVFLPPCLLKVVSTGGLVFLWGKAAPSGPGAALTGPCSFSAPNRDRSGTPGVKVSERSVNLGWSQLPEPLLSGLEFLVGNLQNTRKSNGEVVPRAGVGGGPCHPSDCGDPDLLAPCVRGLCRMEGRGGGVQGRSPCLGQWVALGRTWLLPRGHPHLALPSLCPWRTVAPHPRTQAFLALRGPLIVSSYPPPSPLEHSALSCKPWDSSKNCFLRRMQFQPF